MVIGEINDHTANGMWSKLGSTADEVLSLSVTKRVVDEDHSRHEKTRRPLCAQRAHVNELFYSHGILNWAKLKYKLLLRKNMRNNAARCANREAAGIRVAEK